MTDDIVRTIVKTDEGDLEFQEYFVHRRCEPRVKGFRFEGVESAKPAPGAREAVDSADLILISPSNPWVSIDPILRVVELSEKRVVAVSPIIGGQTVKGPAAKMFRELGIEPSALAVADHYRDILTGFVLDSIDAELAQKLEVESFVTDILMKSPEDRKRLANEVLIWMGNL
jgi:LPPG:FO 2-phospho-L-lactate transferase